MGQCFNSLLIDLFKLQRSYFPPTFLRPASYAELLALNAPCRMWWRLLSCCAE